MFFRSHVFLDGSGTLINTAMERIFMHIHETLKLASHARSRRFEPCIAHHLPTPDSP